MIEYQDEYTHHNFVLPRTSIAYECGSAKCRKETAREISKAIRKSSHFEFCENIKGKPPESLETCNCCFCKEYRGEILHPGVEGCDSCMEEWHKRYPF